MSEASPSRWKQRPTPSGRATLLASTLVLMVAVPGAAWSGVNATTLALMAPAMALMAVVLATATAVPYAAILLWFDRHEQEPWWLLLASFLWGATAAAGVSMLINDAVTAVGVATTGDADAALRFTVMVSAPPVEEALKATALVVLLSLFRHHVDDVLDGMLYGALVGLGFAWFENILYYTNAGAAGPSSMLGLAWIRGVLSGVGSHATFTALTGVGFGISRVARRAWLQVAAPVVGLLTAIVAHVVWNVYSHQLVYAFGEGPASYMFGAPLAVLLLQLPFISILLAILGTTWRAQDRTIRTFLLTEPAHIASRTDVASLVPARRRVRRSARALARGGLIGWWRHRQLSQTLIKLAFERWHHQREGLPWAADEDATVAELRAEVVRLRSLGVEV